MIPDDTFIKIALENKKEDTPNSPKDLEMEISDNFDSVSISNIDFSSEEISLSSIELIYAHKPNFQFIPDTKYINRSEHEFSMSDDIQIIEKTESPSSALIKKADEFLSKDSLERNRNVCDAPVNTNNDVNRTNSIKNVPDRTIELLDSQDVNSKSNKYLVNYNNRKSITNNKYNSSTEFESNYDDCLINNSGNKNITNNNIMINNTKNDINIYNNNIDYNNILSYNDYTIENVNLKDDTLFYFNKLKKENLQINENKIKLIFYCLREVFKIDRFRTNQLQIINTVLENKDTFVLMPTGGGKSLCYQLPVILEERVSIVISPLIALIKDQVETLLRLDIPAVAFYGNMRKMDKETCFLLLEEWIHKRGLVKIFYVTPELLNSSQRLLNILSKIKVRFVIDEVHCLTQWGNDFRPDYLTLDLKKFNAPILCLTATATSSVVQSICTNLGINPVVYSQSFLRNNLIYKVIDKSKLKGKSMKDAVIKDIVSFINVYYKECSGIIYCISKKECEELCSALIYYNLKTYFYHAGLSSKERESIQTEWSNSNSIMIATIAFGMGINKKDVRFVIHYSIPKSLDCYYQETGRAGRDGLTAECIMYYHYSDRIRIFKMTRSKEVDRVVELCESKECRRINLLKYFKESSDKCFKCDNCINGNKETINDNLINKESVSDLLLNYLRNNSGISSTKLLKECKINKSNESILRELIYKGRVKEQVIKKGRFMRILLYYVK